LDALGTLYGLGPEPPSNTSGLPFVLVRRPSLPSVSGQGQGGGLINSGRLEFMKPLFGYSDLPYRWLVTCAARLTQHLSPE
jgi:hypothetical protein